MKTMLYAALLLAVAGCGVDGEPETPQAKSGLTISGEARVGVVYTE